MLAAVASAQESNYKVVFDMTSKDTVNQQSLIRQLNGIISTNPGAQLEVVIYSYGIGLVTKGGSSQEAAVSKLLSNKGVSFKVCAATMKRNKIEKDQLIPGVEVVQDGIYQIITRQREGWGYIKVAN